MKQHLWSMFAVDLRGLAALRMGFGLMLLFDVSIRAQSLTAHYTDAGTLPRSVRTQIATEFGVPWSLSLNMLSGESWWQTILLVMLGIAATLATVGYKTRLSLLLCQVLLISFHGRNPFVLQGGDDFLRCMLFWCLFLPMGAVCSIDARLAKRRNNDIALTPSLVTSWATVGLILQLCVMYWFTALMKTGEPWRRTFDASYMALCTDHFTTSIGYWFTQFPEMLRGLTVGVLAWEFFGPFLLFMPVVAWRGSCRMFAAAGFLGMHLGLNLCMNLGLFSWICCCAWLVVLPTGFWDWLGNRSPPLRSAGVEGVRRPTLLPSNAIVNAFLITMIAYVFLVNICRLDRPLYAQVQLEPLQSLGQTVGLNQHWPMFSPAPSTYGSWFLVRGQLNDGREVDLWHHEQELSVKKPTLVARQYATAHWRRSFIYLVETPTPAYQRSFLEYFIRQWNDAHAQNEQVHSAEIVYYYAQNSLDWDHPKPKKIESITLMAVEK